MRWAWWAVSGLCSSLCAVACGETERDGIRASGGTASGAGGSSAGTSAQGGSSSGGAEARSFLDKLWGAYCKQLMTCAIPNGEVIGQRLLMGTEAGCLDALRELLGEEPPIHDLLAKLEAGSIRFVPEHAEACLAEAADCIWHGNLSNGPACRAVFEGSVPLAGECRRWEDCAGDAYCDHASGCPGRCVPLGEPGAACETNAHCRAGNGYAVCYPSESARTCKRVPLGARAKLGAPCTVVGDPDRELVRCEDALWCDAGDGSLPTGVCRQPIAAGGACDSADDVCAGDTWCFGRVRCEPPKVVRVERAACDNAAQLHCDALAGLVCVAGTCQRLGNGAQGSACRSSDILERVTCNHGLYCRQVDASTQTCEPLLAANAPCTSDDQCASGACAGTCAESYCDG